MTLKRADVAVIKLAENLNVINSIPEPGPGPTPNASPTPSQGTVPAQETSPDKTNKEKRSPKDTDTPPWFNVDGCQWTAKPYVFVDGSLIEMGRKTRCRMWLNVCGTVISREKIVDHSSNCWSQKDISQPQICCDIWNKYVNNPDSKWNPKVDADGDGLSNDQDDDPLSPRPPR